MKKYYWIGAALLAVLLFLLAGRFLVVDEAPAKADVIIVLSGDEGRLEKGFSLMQAGYADRMIITRTDGRGGIRLGEAEAMGIPQEAIIPERNATSTYTNAVYSKDIMLKSGFKSALVVSSNYHMRRVSYTFNKVYKKSGIELTYVSAPSAHFKPWSWFTKKTYFRFACSEYVKLLGYLIMY